MLSDARQALAGALKISGCLGLALPHALQLFFHKTARGAEADLGEAQEFFRVVFERRAPEVEDDELRAEPRGEVDGLEGMFERAFALAGVGRGEFVAVGRG